MVSARYPCLVKVKLPTVCCFVKTKYPMKGIGRGIPRVWSGYLDDKNIIESSD